MIHRQQLAIPIDVVYVQLTVCNKRCVAGILTPVEEFEESALFEVGHQWSLFLWQGQGDNSPDFYKEHQIIESNNRQGIRAVRRGILTIPSDIVSLA
jgi:hypothetical protein